jgi:hypothetical protein
MEFAGVGEGAVKVPEDGALGRLSHVGRLRDANYTASLRFTPAKRRQGQVMPISFY